VPAPLHRFIRRPQPAGGLGHWVHTFVLHVMTGFLAVAAHYAVMYALVHAGAAGVPASAVGFVFGAMTRFALSYWHIFAPSRGVRIAGLRFVLAIALQLALNSALLSALLDYGVSLWPAQVATTIVLTFVNYLAYRLWVFR
jgi:putative flippase GtrA